MKTKVRGDTQLSNQDFSELFGAIDELEKAIDDFRRFSNLPGLGPDLSSLEKLRRKVEAVEALEGLKNPSYLDEFAATLAEHPYALPKSLFDPQGRETVVVHVPNNQGKPQINRERLDLALSVLYPGSFTYRYYGIPIKIATGSWSQTFVAHLASSHKLSPEPIFELQREGKKFPVFKPLMLSGLQVGNRRPYICTTCLSVSSTDEECNHSPHMSKQLKLPSSAAIVVHQELSRSMGEELKIHPPLDSLISTVSYLSSLRIGMAVLGFERTVLNRITAVDYDPPIGMIMETRGISFKVNLSDAFIDQVASNHYLVRDLAVQVAARRLSSLLRQNGLPTYHLEPILSGLIQATGLDAPTELDAVILLWRSRSWIEEAVHYIISEAGNYYERFDLKEEQLRTLLTSFTALPLDRANMNGEIRIRLLHSLAHALLVAGCITSGCLPTDLDYMVGEREIVVFDSVDGGNGASEMIFEFCTSERDFTLAEREEKDTLEKAYRPKYFDESLMELILPCQQGVAERIFHRGLPQPKYQEIARRLVSLRSQEDVLAEPFHFIKERGIESCFVDSIGYRVPYARQLSLRDAEKLKEGLGICIHGCPDCLALGDKCTSGGSLEKYNISKILLDDYFRHITSPVTLTINQTTTDQEIENLLQYKHVAIIRAEIPASGLTEEGLQEKVTEFDGKKIGDGYVKFSGFWVDSPLDSSIVSYSAMLVLI